MTSTNCFQSIIDLSNLIGQPVETIERLSGGRNSQVFNIVTDNGQEYAAKRYFQNPSDNRDQQGVEFRSLLFLWEKGFRCIPKPIGLASELRWSIFEFAGEIKISSQTVTPADIDFLCDFLLDLSQLTNIAESESIPSASEACFSIAAIIDNINSRLKVLFSTDDKRLLNFLRDKYQPALGSIISWCRKRSADTDINLTTDLGIRELTLSPSDFGFHNAVRRSDGSIVFLDFEYFGWDDPAKMVSDFLLHPAMTLDPQLLNRFSNIIVKGFSHNHKLSNRIRLTYPLFGLKWCLILLNEFLPANMARRRFAAKHHQRSIELRDEQLTKATVMLERVNREYEDFPYFD